MAWLRRDDQTPTEGEQEWISDLLDPLHGRGDNADDTTELDAETADATESPVTEPGDGTPRRSVADVIGQAEPLPRIPQPEQSKADEPDVITAAEGVELSDTGAADPAPTRSAADVLAAANRTGETTGTSTTEAATESVKPANQTTTEPNEPTTETAAEEATDPRNETATEPAREAQDSLEAELPANYATRVSTTREIPTVDETNTNIPMPGIDPNLGIAPTLAQIMQIEGALGTALVDYVSGETLDSHSTDGAPDVALAASGESAVIRTKIASLVQLDSEDDIDELFTTLGRRYHLTRMVRETETSGLFLYLVLDREVANLAMARHKLALAANQLEV